MLARKTMLPLGAGPVVLAMLLPAIPQLRGQGQPQQVTGTGSASTPFVLRVTTREVLLDVVALDNRDRVIRDLKPGEVSIFELRGRNEKVAERLTGFRVVDPATDHGSSDSSSAGFRVTVGGECARRATLHYEIAYHATSQGWQSGYHRILVQTTRSRAKLFYMDRYYVGETAPLTPIPTNNQAEAALQEAACYHSAIPPTIALTARQVQTGQSNLYRFFVTVDADSLSLISTLGLGRRVELDYGVCTFDRRGQGLRYMRATVDRMLSSSENAQAVVHGLPNLVEFPSEGSPAMARVAVRDRVTGNLGFIDLVLAPPAPRTLTADEQEAETQWIAELNGISVADDMPSDPNAGGFGGQGAHYKPPPMGPIGSFGSVVPGNGALCGDVYELPTGTPHLPTFWNLSSVGSLYTDTLGVPHQQFWNSGGLPGLIRRTDWFGIDYHGTFWVSEAGLYEFEMMVDDGAKLIIDDHTVIDLNGMHDGVTKTGKIKLDAGEHAIRVPYFQGTQNAVGLMLLVKAPRESDFRGFDMRAFAPPAQQGNAGAAAR